MTDDDPFAVFADDDDEDDDHENGEDGNMELTSGSHRAQELMKEANERMKQRATEPSRQKPTHRDHDPLASTRHDAIDMTKLDRARLSWNLPLYMGPMVLVASLPFGGGRGFVASKDLAPGTLILAEKSMIQWPKAQVGKELGLISVRYVLEQQDAQRMVHDMEDFHPTKLALDEWKQGDIQTRGMTENLEQAFGDSSDLEGLVIFAKERGLKNRDGGDLSRRDMIRMLLTLRYNGFESGVYLHFSMLNHSCSPNSVKFMPESGYSEVRTTRSVQAGEALTISYISRLHSHAYRRSHLWEQHRFDIGEMPLLPAMEMVEGHIPVSSTEGVDPEAPTSRIEKALESLEDQLAEAAAEIVANKSAANPVWELAKALELSALELYNEAKNQLKNEKHLLLVPCLRLHLDVGDMLHTGGVLSKDERMMLLCRLVASARTLLELQTDLFGKDHFELARTNSDLAQSIEELLAQAPKQLLECHYPGMETFESCSRLEWQSRKEHERIRDLYPHDADERIAQA